MPLNNKKSHKIIFKDLKTQLKDSIKNNPHNLKQTTISSSNLLK